MEYTYTVVPGKTVNLSDYEPGATQGISLDVATRRIADLNVRLAELQEMQYAAGQHAVLIILQGLDAAGCVAKAPEAQRRRRGRHRQGSPWCSSRPTCCGWHRTPAL